MKTIGLFGFIKLAREKLPKMVYDLIVVIVLFGLPSNAVSAAEVANVSVHLFECYPPVSKVYVKGPLIIQDSPSRTMPSGIYEIASNKDMVSLTSLSKMGGSGLLRARVLSLLGLSRDGLSISYANKLTRHYRGTVKIMIAEDGNLFLSNVVPKRDYVFSVVGSETFPDWPLEALKCQAVLCQTRLARYKPQDMLGDSTQKEVYLGCERERPEVKTAVTTVEGQIITANGLPIVPFYHSVCAGRTSNGEIYFRKPYGSLPYLKNVDCKYCSGSVFAKTKQCKIPLPIFKRAFANGMPKIVTRDAAGRPLEVVFDNGETMSGYDFWIRLGQRLGWDKCPGTRFNISRSPDGSVVLESNGAGHGVGLCQWGAYEQARQGKSYKQIIQYYFHSVAIEKQ